jgi:hypothetical protein
MNTLPSPPPANPSLPRSAGAVVKSLLAISAGAVLLGLFVPLFLIVLGIGPHTGIINGPSGRCISEICYLEMAIDSFTNHMGPAYFPSRIKLCEKFDDYDLNEILEKDSVDYLTQIWPHLLDIDPKTGVIPWRSNGIDWNGDGKHTEPVVLEGDQCMVFFLGGIPQHGTSPGCIGFSTDPRDPAKLSQSKGRKGPFFEFPCHRLITRGQARYYSFADPYSKGQPYAYFSSYGVKNGYGKYGSSDCSSLAVSPYFESTNLASYYNPTSCQILSAGADGIFGPGGLWTATKAANLAPAGRDDHSNINNGALMGISP